MSTGAHHARLDALGKEHAALVAERESEFDAACATKRADVDAACASERAVFDAHCVEKEGELGALKAAEAALQDRLAAMHALVKGVGAGAPVALEVDGQMFATTVGTLTKIPRSILAAQWQAHHSSGRDGPLLIDGNSEHFKLILAYLRHTDELPIVGHVSQIQWLEREAKCYHLPGLATLCRDAYKRLDTVKVMELLNGQKNLSGTDIRELDLSDIDFSGASLYRARGDGAILTDVLLCSDAAGKRTNLKQAALSKVCAARADFSNALMERTVLNECSATDAIFDGAMMVISGRVRRCPSSVVSTRASRCGCTSCSLRA